jgi:hypothetical protein
MAGIVVLLMCGFIRKYMPFYHEAVFEGDGITQASGSTF